MDQKAIYKLSLIALNVILPIEDALLKIREEKRYNAESRNSNDFSGNNVMLMNDISKILNNNPYNQNKD